MSTVTSAHSEPQRLRKRLQQRRVVVDDEDARRFMASAAAWRSRGCSGQRELDEERGAFAGRAHDRDGAAVLLDDAVGDGETQSGALPDLLGREERIEDPPLEPGGIPCPVSANATSTAAAPTEPEMRMALRGESAIASRALVNRLMNTCSSWMAFPMTTGSSGPRSTVTSISRSRSCSCMRDSARSMTCLRSIGSRLAGAARPNVRRCEMISVALRTCCMAWRSSRDDSLLVRHGELDEVDRVADEQADVVERVVELVRDAGGELAERGELSRLDQLLLFVAQLLFAPLHLAVVSRRSPMM